MPLHLPYSIPNYAPVRKPKPPYPVGPLEEPTVCIRLNPEYIPYILGLLEVYTWDDLWIGTQEEKDLAVSRTRELMEVFIDANEDCGEGSETMACDCGAQLNAIAAALRCICGALEQQVSLGEIVNEVELPEPYEELPESIGTPIGEQTPEQAADVLCLAIFVFLASVAKGIDAHLANLAVAGSALTTVLGLLPPPAAYVLGLILPGLGAIYVSSITELIDDEDNWQEIACALYKYLDGVPRERGPMYAAMGNVSLRLEGDALSLWLEIVTSHTNFPIENGFSALANLFMQSYENAQLAAADGGADLDSNVCEDCSECCDLWDFRKSRQHWEPGAHGSYVFGQGYKSEFVAGTPNAARINATYDCPEGENQDYWGMRVEYTVTAYFADRGFTTGPSIRLYSNDTLVTERFLAVGQQSAPLTGVRVMTHTSDGSFNYNNLQLFQNSQENLSSDRTEVTIHSIELYCEAPD